MNIFFLSPDPCAAARMLCDKHVPKMLLESVQLLSTARHLQGRPHPYKPAHARHPCTLWVAAHPANYFWLWLHAEELAHEYTRRYGREHKSAQHLPDLAQPSLYLHFPTSPALAMPEQYKCADPVQAYRAYYIGEKARFAKWELGTPAPTWWPKETT